MNNDAFSLDELYKRMIPCLNSKLKEFNREGIDYIKKEDIWNYMMKNKWKDKEPFISDMVNDVLNTENYLIKDYVDGYIKDRGLERES